MPHPPDIIFINGQVITVDPENPACEAVGVTGRRISHVGFTSEIRPLASSQTRVLDLKGHALLPGFIDAHCHPVLHASNFAMIDCGSKKVRSIADLEAAVRQRAAITPPGDWIRGWGYNHTVLDEKRHPNRWDLDRAAPGHKVFISRTCGHVGAANSLALSFAGYSAASPDPEGGRIERDQRGEPTGVLYETALKPFMEITRPTLHDINQGLDRMHLDLISRGITSVHDASGWHSDEIQAYQMAMAADRFKVRVYFMFRSSKQGSTLGDHYLGSGLMTGFGNEKLRLGGYKLMMDGSGSGKSAALRQAYNDDPENHGILWMNQEELDREVMRGHGAGFQVAVHAIGDRAVEMTVNAFARALELSPRPNHRHRIEHCGLLDPELLDRMRDLSLVAALGLPFLYEMGDNYIQVFGHDRIRYLYPLRSLIERGVVAALSSDTPVMDPNPLHGIYAAVAHKTRSGQTFCPEEKVDLQTAIRAYTLAGAYASFEENLKGSIERGKLADLVVLSDRLDGTTPEDILRTQVDLTMIDGRIVYERHTSSRI